MGEDRFGEDADNETNGRTKIGTYYQANAG
jgi:hypothetical protein